MAFKELKVFNLGQKWKLPGTYAFATYLAAQISLIIKLWRL